MDKELLKLKIILNINILINHISKVSYYFHTTNGAESFDERTYNGEIRIWSTLLFRDLRLFSFDFCTSHDEVFVSYTSFQSNQLENNRFSLFHGFLMFLLQIPIADAVWRQVTDRINTSSKQIKLAFIRIRWHLRLTCWFFF